MSIKISSSLEELLSETTAELARKYSHQERLEVLSKMLQSAWVLIPCESQLKCSDCKNKQFCDELLKLVEFAQELVKNK